MLGPLMNCPKDTLAERKLTLTELRMVQPLKLSCSKPVGSKDKEPRFFSSSAAMSQ